MTQENPRDPGKIGGAFPSRAGRIMANLRGFHEQVMTTNLSPEEISRRQTYADNNPESEAAMHVAASGGRTSGRSPVRPSAAMRSQLTGVTENLNQQGWMEAPTALPHLCFPPDTYPKACGPGSQWRCRCGAVWVSSGIMWSEYPQTPTRTEENLGPERWHYVKGGQLAEDDYRVQEGLYDWRPLGPYYVKLYRAMIDNQLSAMGEGPRGESTAPTDWRDLG
jgi:hypothetical protein